MLLLGIMIERALYEIGNRSFVHLMVFVLTLKENWIVPVDPLFYVNHGCEIRNYVS